MTTATDTVTIARPDQAALARTADSALSLVEGFEVTDAATYEIGAEELRGIKAKAAQLDTQRKAITKPLDEAKAAVMDLFRGPIDLLTRAEGILKGKLLAYQQEEQRKAREAQLQAERAAQAERDRLAAEAAALAAQGRAGEAMVKEQVASMIVAQPPAVQEAPKVSGLATRTTVEFEVVDLVQLVQHIAQHPELIGLIAADSVKLRAYVRGLGLSTNLPGVRVFEKASLSSARR
jgi:hypothetical protein